MGKARQLYDGMTGVISVVGFAREKSEGGER